MYLITVLVVSLIATLSQAQGGYCQVLSGGICQLLLGYCHILFGGTEIIQSQARWFLEGGELMVLPSVEVGCQRYRITNLSAVVKGIVLSLAASQHY